MYRTQLGVGSTAADEIATSSDLVSNPCLCRRHSSVLVLFGLFTYRIVCVYLVLMSFCLMSLRSASRFPPLRSSCCWVWRRWRKRIDLTFFYVCVSFVLNMILLWLLCLFCVRSTNIDCSAVPTRQEVLSDRLNYLICCETEYSPCV